MDMLASGLSVLTHKYAKATAQADSQGSVQFNHTFLKNGFSWSSCKTKQTNYVCKRKCLQNQTKVHHKWDLQSKQKVL